MFIQSIIFFAIIIFNIIAVVIFVAASSEQESLVFSAIFGSCSKQKGDHSFWHRLPRAVIDKHGQDPASIDRAKNFKVDAMVWLGDVVYADTSYLPGFWIQSSKEKVRATFNKMKHNQNYSHFVNHNIKDRRVLLTGDDHDYNLNDGGKYNPFKKDAQEIFLDFIDVHPDDFVRRKMRQGVYSFEKIRIPDDPLNMSVCFLLLDVRFNRDDPVPSGEGDVLGLDQWKWLEAALTTGEDVERYFAESMDDPDPTLTFKQRRSMSHAYSRLYKEVRLANATEKFVKWSSRFRKEGPESHPYFHKNKIFYSRPIYSIDDVCAVTFIGSGTQIISDEKPSESWGMFPKARDELLKLLGSSGARKVVLLSGDVHLGEIFRLWKKQEGSTTPDESESPFARFFHPGPVGSDPQALYEVTSSGFTHDSSTLLPSQLYSHIFPNPQRRFENAILMKNFGVIRLFEKQKQEAQKVKNEGKEYRVEVSIHSIETGFQQQWISPKFYPLERAAIKNLDTYDLYERNFEQFPEIQSYHLETNPSRLTSIILGIQRVVAPNASRHKVIWATVILVFLSFVVMVLLTAHLVRKFCCGGRNKKEEGTKERVEKKEKKE